MFFPQLLETNLLSQSFSGPNDIYLFSNDKQWSNIEDKTLCNKNNNNNSLQAQTITYHKELQLKCCIELELNIAPHPQRFWKVSQATSTILCYPYLVQ